MSGEYDFSLKRGGGKWKRYTFTLGEGDISVMPQPMGTLYSIGRDQNGKKTPKADAYMRSHLVIFDCGMGTLDLFGIENGQLGKVETDDSLGMKRVLQETSGLIMKELRTEVPVPAMQKHLSTGKVRIVDRRAMTSKDVDFADLLERASRDVCEKAIEKARETFRGFAETQYLVVTGGTGQAWLEQIKERLKGMETLEVISGDVNDNVPGIFANVRGYYMFLQNRLRTGK